MIMVVMKVWCDVLCEELQLGEFNKESLLNMFVLLNLLLLFCSVLKADLVLSKLFCFRLYEIQTSLLSSVFILAVILPAVDSNMQMCIFVSLCCSSFMHIIVPESSYIRTWLIMLC